MHPRTSGSTPPRRHPPFMPSQERVGNVVIRIMSALNVWVLYRNVEANPRVTVEIGGERRSMRAQRASDAEKAALWPKLVAMYRDFDDYQARTERDIPVVILTPV